MVFGSVFEVSFRASAVFCAFGIENHRRYRKYMKGSIIPYNNSWVYASAFLSMLKSRNISLPITYFFNSPQKAAFSYLPYPGVIVAIFRPYRLLSYRLLHPLDYYNR